jgi:dTDP-4-amino-4,6-dideoxygalactose transaminase
MTNAGLAVPRANSKPKLPFLDLKAQFNSLQSEVMSAVSRVIESQHFILGPEVTALEQEIAAYVGVKHAIGCASGSDALLLALMALNIGPGDEVITVPFTFVATVGSIVRLGAKPVFVDIDSNSYNMDPAAVEAAITSRTKAILPVHLFGQAAELGDILSLANQRGIPVIEDAAQAIGAQYKNKMVGSLGLMGCFSFFPSKNLGGFGDGGLITTNDDKVADKLKVLRTHGSRKKYSYELLGMNSRLDALQAAILRVKLPHLGSWAEGRRRNAARYRSMFAAADLREVGLPSESQDRHHVYNQFTIRVDRRDSLREHLHNEGVPTEIYYPSPLHIQEAFVNLGYKLGDFPVSEKACQQVISLPIFAELKEEQQQTVVNAIQHFYSLGEQSK